MQTITMTCQCGKTYQAREADVKRGWGKSCSKRCAAITRTKKESSGNFKVAQASKKYKRTRVNTQPKPNNKIMDGSRLKFIEEFFDDLDDDLSWDAHKH